MVSLDCPYISKSRDELDLFLEESLRRGQDCTIRSAASQFVEICRVTVEQLGGMPFPLPSSLLASLRERRPRIPLLRNRSCPSGRLDMTKLCGSGRETLRP